MPRGNRNLKLNNTPWPEARTNRLRYLFANGYTDQQIADALRVSKRAVIGKRLRLGLKRWTQHDGDPLVMAIRRQAREDPDEQE